MATYDEMDHDILREIGNIGSGHASVAMSILTSKKSRISHTQSSISTPSSLLEAELSAKKPIDIIHLGIGGDLKGDCLLMLFNDSAKALNLIIAKANKTKQDEPSTLIEFANILIGSYLNALSNLINLHAIPTVPAIRKNQTIAKKNELLQSFINDSAKRMISIKTQLTITELRIDLAILLFFTPESIQKILNRTRLRNILIVDDSSLMRTRLKRSLEGFQNIKVFSTDSLSHSQELFQQTKPSVCFIDLVMNDKSGFDLLKALQKKRKKTQFIVMSTVGSKMMKDKVEATGARFMKKPIKKKDIISLIDSL